MCLSFHWLYRNMTANCAPLLEKRAVHCWPLLSTGPVQIFANMDLTLHDEHDLPTRHSILDSSANVQPCDRLWVDIENNGQIS